MFGLVKTAVRFFFLGMAVGVLLAPRRGEDTRELIRRRMNEVVSSVLEIADVQPASSSADEGGDDSGEPAGPKRARRRGQAAGASAG